MSKEFPRFTVISTALSEISISTNLRNLSQFLQLLYTVKGKEENLIENHTAFPMV
jgi:hypothetical protein